MPPTANRDFLRRIRTPAYVFLLLTLLFQLVDFVSASTPLRIDSVVWRFATAGGVSNSAGNFLLLTLLIYTVALLYVDRRMLTFVGAVSAFLALMLLIGTGSFALDALQLRSRVDPSAIRHFDLASMQAFVKLAIESVVSAFFAISAFRAVSAADKEIQREERNFDSPIVSRSAPLRAP